MQKKVYALLASAFCAGISAFSAEANRGRPQGYRYVDLRKPYQRTYGGYLWIGQEGDICEEGITVEGNPLICSRDIMAVLEAAQGELRDLHFVDGDIRRTWCHGARHSALFVFTKACPDPLVGSWGTYEPVFFRFRPGIMVEDVRRPGYTETSGAQHKVGALTYRTVRPRPSPLQVTQRWYIAGKWCLVGCVEVRNLTADLHEDASVAVGLNLRPRVSLNRGQLNWYADFHSNGKAGVPEVPRLSDREYQVLRDMTLFDIEYRPQKHCILARTGYGVRDSTPSFYFLCLLLNAPVASHVMASSADVHKLSLFQSTAKYPQRLKARSAAVALRSKPFQLTPGGTHTLTYAIALGRTAQQALANAQRGVAVPPAAALRKLQAMWSTRLPCFTTGNAYLNALLRYAAVTHDVNWEPDGRVSGDLGGWGRAERAELCGYKNYYDQDDTVVPILDVPVYDPPLFQRALLYDIDPATKRLRKCCVWRQQYDNMLLWPSGAYKLWRATGDDRFLKRIYPILNNTLRWLQRTRARPDGMLRMLTMPYDMFTVGIGEDEPVTVRAQALACNAFRAMIHMAEHLHRASDSRFYRQWLRKLTQAVRKQLWRDNFYSMALQFPEHLSISGNCSAILAGLCSLDRAASICREMRRLSTGWGFPELHPPLPWWVGSPPYSYQNGDMYVDQLALIARAANRSRDGWLLSQTLSLFQRIVARWKCFPVTIHPWNGNQRSGVNEIHSASALIAVLLYGVGGLEEGESLRFRPLMVPEVGGVVEMRDIRYRGTRFQVRIEGQGGICAGVRIDGKALPQALVPPEYCDGKTHKVVIRMRRK